MLVDTTTMNIMQDGHFAGKCLAFVLPYLQSSHKSVENVLESGVIWQIGRNQNIPSGFVGLSTVTARY